MKFGVGRCRGSARMGPTEIAPEGILKTLRYIVGATCQKLPVKFPVACFILLCAAAFSVCAQDAGISAGGKWMEFDSQDKMTLAKTARFELAADSSLPGSDSSPKILLFCT